MNAYRLSTKLDFDPSVEIDQESLIPIFHRFIQNQELDELLIDVADYKHVPQGPGVMLIAHEANYGLDRSDGRLGLLYSRKRPAGGSFADRVRDAFGKVLVAASALAREEGLAAIRTAGDRWSFRINDRLLAPSSESTFRAVEPALRSLLDDLYDRSDYEIAWQNDRRQVFAVRIEAKERPGVVELLHRFEAAAWPVAV